MNVKSDMRSAVHRTIASVGVLVLAAIAVTTTGDDVPRIDPATGKTVAHCSQCGASLDGSEEFCTVCAIEVSGGEEEHESDADADDS